MNIGKTEWWNGGKLPACKQDRQGKSECSVKSITLDKNNFFIRKVKIFNNPVFQYSGIPLK